MKKMNHILETSAGVINHYLEQIKDNQPLTMEEEQELGRRILSGDTAARNKLIEANLRFVLTCAINMYVLSRCPIFFGNSNLACLSMTHTTRTQTTGAATSSTLSLLHQRAVISVATLQRKKIIYVLSSVSGTTLVTFSC